jgi:xanthine/CO dehydrogenase XdhC/CoxF family maturation factor
MADEVRVTWPGPVFAERGDRLGARDAVCILTHDPKFDVPAIIGALATRAGYIGVMGSARRWSTTRRLLVGAGVDEASLGRIRTPIGVEIGAEVHHITAAADVLVAVGGGVVDPADEHRLCIEQPGGLRGHGWSSWGKSMSGSGQFSWVGAGVQGSTSGIGATS